MCFECILCGYVFHCPFYFSHPDDVDWEQAGQHLLDCHPGYLDPIALAPTKGV